METAFSPPGRWPPMAWPRCKVDPKRCFFLAAVFFIFLLNIYRSYYLLLRSLAGLPITSDGDRIGDLLQRWSVKTPGCSGPCCHVGDKEVACLDVEACAAESPKNWTTKPRYALVMTNVGVPSGHLLQNIRSMKAAALAAGAEILVLLKKSDAEKMSSETQYLLKKWGVEVRFVPWSLPPKMIYEKQSWCGQMDFIRLHVLALEDFDAVAYYDVDCEFQGDILPVLQCASRGFFLTTSGGVGEDLNVGFFAVRPDQRLLDAAVYFASHNNFSREDAWGHSGWRPRGFYYVGGECGQGFFYNLSTPGVRLPGKRWKRQVFGRTKPFSLSNWIDAFGITKQAGDANEALIVIACGYTTSQPRSVAASPTNVRSYASVKSGAKHLWRNAATSAVYDVKLDQKNFFCDIGAGYVLVQTTMISCA